MPETALYGLAVGHTLWGVVAYGDLVTGIVRELPGSVGDGIFEKAHSRDARAAGFWFLFVGPLVALLGRLYGAAEDSGDRAAMLVAGRAVTVVSVAGWTIIPRSGFPGGVALGLWLSHRAKQQSVDTSSR